VNDDHANDTPSGPSQSHSGTWHLASGTTNPPTSRAAMTDCHACEGPIAAYASLPQANAAGRLLLGLQPYPAGGRCPE
jgi:hypothetical protein